MNESVAVMLRVLRGEMSQESTAELLETTQPQVSRYENAENTPDLDRFAEIAEKFDLKLVVGLEADEGSGPVEIRWPVPHNLDDEYTELLDAAREMTPAEREEVYRRLYESLAEGAEVDASGLDGDAFAEIRSALDRAFENETSDAAARKIMKAKRLLPDD